MALTVSYRKQRLSEDDVAGKRSAYTAAATQLGDPSPTVRLAGVYALANLADAWPEQRQQCVDVLCGHLRVPWTSEREVDEIELGDNLVPTPEFVWGETQVRTTILTVITDHLRPARKLPPGVYSWSKMHLDLTGAKIPSWDVDDCSFKGRLSTKSLRLLPDQKLSFRFANLSGANLIEADFNKVILKGADLTKTMLCLADLTEADLTKTTLYWTDLREANLTEANLREADLTFVNLTDANLTGADLRGVHVNKAGIMEVMDMQAMGMLQSHLVEMARANFTNADLSRANLYDANLTGANLTDAILIRANLTDADFTGAKQTGLKLSEAILTRAQGLAEPRSAKHCW